MSAFFHNIFISIILYVRERTGMHIAYLGAKLLLFFDICKKKIKFCSKKHKKQKVNKKSAPMKDTSFANRFQSNVEEAEL